MNKRRPCNEHTQTKPFFNGAGFDADVGMHRYDDKEDSVRPMSVS